MCAVPERAVKASVALWSIMAVIAGGCGDGQSDESAQGEAGASSGAPHEVTVTLNGPAAGSSAGFMYAKELGLYEKVGLDVTIEESGGSALAAAALAAGKTDFAFADTAATMLTRSKGGEIEILAVVHQDNGMSVTTLTKSGIDDIGELSGKTVAIQPGSAQTALFDAVLATNDLTGKVRLTNVDASALTGSLLQGRVDAILGSPAFNSVNMRNQGAEVSDMLFSSLGVPTVGLGISTSSAMLDEDPDTVRKFVAASLEGWDEARQDRAAAAAAIAEQFPAGGDAEVFEQQLDVVADQLLCVPGSKSLGAPPDDYVSETFDLLTKHQGLPATPAVDAYFDWSYLPDDAAAC